MSDVKEKHKLNYGKTGRTHSRVLLGAIGDDLHVVAIHVVAEEIIEVRLGPLTSKDVQVAVPLLGEMTKHQLSPCGI